MSADLGAYDDWARLEEETGEQFVTRTGGLDLFPPGAVIPMDDYTASLAAHDIAFEVLDVDGVGERWPRSRCRRATVAILSRPAPESCLPPRELPRWHAVPRTSARGCHDNTRVERSVPAPTVRTSSQTDGVISAGRVGGDGRRMDQVLLAPLGVDVPLTVTENRSPTSRLAGRRLQRRRFPVWIWMDEPSYYGFPTYGEADRQGRAGLRRPHRDGR